MYRNDYPGDYPGGEMSVGQGISSFNIQKSLGDMDATSPEYSSTSQEHILEDGIVRTAVVDIGYS